MLVTEVYCFGSFIYKSIMRKFYLLITLQVMFLSAISQTASNNYEPEPLNFEASFLDVNLNTRLRGFGEVDVVSSSFYKNTGLYGNPALLSKNAKHSGVYFTYMPWLSNIVDDINFSSFTAYYAIDSSNAIGLNFSRFDYGELTHTSDAGDFLGNSEPLDFYLKLIYNRTFNKAISAGIAVKYFRSDYDLYNVEGYKPVNSYAIDIGISYDKKYTLNSLSFLNVAAGLDITNFGPKISNVEGANKDFLPTNLALGLFINPDIGFNDKFRLNIELGYQASKYLVPTSPYIVNGEIIEGYDSDISPFQALYQSFYDAPDGFEEELDEIRHRFGNELRLSYIDRAYIALRHGRQIENKYKGNRNYQTWGLGIGVYGFTLDYMKIKSNENKPLDNTWAISIGYRFNLEKGFFGF